MVFLTLIEQYSRMEALIVIEVCKKNVYGI